MMHWIDFAALILGLYVVSPLLGVVIGLIYHAIQRARKSEP